MKWTQCWWNKWSQFQSKHYWGENCRNGHPGGETRGEDVKKAGDAQRCDVVQRDDEDSADETDGVEDEVTSKSRSETKGIACQVWLSFPPFPPFPPHLSSFVWCVEQLFLLARKLFHFFLLESERTLHANLTFFQSVSAPRQPFAKNPTVVTLPLYDGDILLEHTFPWIWMTVSIHPYILSVCLIFVIVYAKKWVNSI